MKTSVKHFSSLILTISSSSSSFDNQMKILQFNTRYLHRTLNLSVIRSLTFGAYLYLIPTLYFSVIKSFTFVGAFHAFKISSPANSKYSIFVSFPPRNETVLVGTWNVNFIVSGYFNIFLLSLSYCYYYYHGSLTCFKTW